MLLTKTLPLIPPVSWWCKHSLLEMRDSVWIHFFRLWVKLFPDQIFPKLKRFITHRGRQKQTSVWGGLIYSPGWCRQQEALQYYQTLSLVPREGTSCADFIEHGNAPRKEKGTDRNLSSSKSQDSLPHLSLACSTKFLSQLHISVLSFQVPNPKQTENS